MSESLVFAPLQRFAAAKRPCNHRIPGHSGHLAILFSGHLAILSNGWGHLTSVTLQTWNNGLHMKRLPARLCCPDVSLGEVEFCSIGAVLQWVHCLSKIENVRNSWFRPIAEVCSCKEAMVNRNVLGFLILQNDVVWKNHARRNAKTSSHQKKRFLGPALQGSKIKILTNKQYFYLKITLKELS